MNYNLSIDSCKNNEGNNLFREFIKNNSTYIATNNFYIFKNEDNNYEFDKIDNDSLTKIIPFNNLHLLKNKDKNIEEYLDLLVISNISFTLDDINIEKIYLINKFLENDKNIDDKLFEDLYYNEEFSNKINLELPQKYNDKKVFLEDIEINKKYLFKIDYKELNNIFNEEIRYE